MAQIEMPKVREDTQQAKGQPADWQIGLTRSKMGLKFSPRKF